MEQRLPSCLECVLTPSMQTPGVGDQDKGVFLCVCVCVCVKVRQRQVNEEMGEIINQTKVHIPTLILRPPV